MEISAENMGQIDKRDWDDLRAYFRFLIQRSDDLFENWAFYRQSPSKKTPIGFFIFLLSGPSSEVPSTTIGGIRPFMSVSGPLMEK